MGRKADRDKNACSFPTYMHTKNIEIVNLSDDGLPEVPVLGNTHYTRCSNGSIPHVHPGIIEVLYCRRAAGMMLHHEGSKYPFRPNDIVAIQPSSSHTLSPFSKDFQMYWFWLALPRPGKTMFGLSLTETNWLKNRLETLPVHFCANGELKQAFRTVWRIYETVTERKVRNLRLREAMLHLVLCMIDASERECEVQEDNVLKQVVAEMRAHPELEWSIAMLERRLAASAPKISQLFKRETGLPPHTFLLLCRIEAAKRTLESTRRSITSIADELGFASSQHFATLFRRSVGMTPRAWRTEHSIQSIKENV